MNGHDTDELDPAVAEATAAAARRRGRSRWRLAAYAMIGGVTLVALILAVRGERDAAPSAESPAALAADTSPDASAATVGADALLARGDGAIERESLGPPAAAPEVSLPVQATEAAGPEAATAASGGGAPAPDAAHALATPASDAPADATLASEAMVAAAIDGDPAAEVDAGIAEGGAEVADGADASAEEPAFALGDEAALALFGEKVVMVSSTWPELVLLADERRIALGDALADGHRLVGVERERLVLERDDGTRTVVAVR